MIFNKTIDILYITLVTNSVFSLTLKYNLLIKKELIFN